MKKIAILSGAGISAESGLKTFRDSNGLWEGHDVMKVATPEGWLKNRSLVLDFYNQRRAQLQEAMPNEAHHIVAQMEKNFLVEVITQNVDDLHERAGSSSVLHLHGELNKVRSTVDPKLIYEWKGELLEGDLCKKGSQLRPHIVWFGEGVPLLEVAAQKVFDADIVVIVGTSLQVYPAAGLVAYSQNADIYYIDPKPSTSYELSSINFKLIQANASEGFRLLHKQLLR